MIISVCYISAGLLDRNVTEMWTKCYQLTFHEFLTLLVCEEPEMKQNTAESLQFEGANIRGKSNFGTLFNNVNILVYYRFRTTLWKLNRSKVAGNKTPCNPLRAMIDSKVCFKQTIWI